MEFATKWHFEPREAKHIRKRARVGCRLLVTTGV